MQKNPLQKFGGDFFNCVNPAHLRHLRAKKTNFAPENRKSKIEKLTINH
jgi:hypothetical protein